MYKMLLVVCGWIALRKGALLILLQEKALLTEILVSKTPPTKAKQKSAIAVVDIAIGGVQMSIIGRRLKI